MTTRGDGETSGDRSAFVELLGSPGRVKILESFLNHPQASLTVEEVAGFADISQSTFSRNADLLLDLDLIEVADRVGNTTLYRLNQNSDLAAHLAQAQRDLRKQVGHVEPDHWASVDEVPEADVQEASEAEERVAAIVPKLFSTEGAAEREGLAEQLEPLAFDHPEAFVEMVPALIELTDDDNERVADSVLAALSVVVSEHPEVLDEEDISKIFDTMSASFREDEDETLGVSGTDTNDGGDDQPLTDRQRSRKQPFEFEDDPVDERKSDEEATLE
jgi:DNA-binding transcriptional ArsR family regulator